MENTSVIQREDHAPVNLAHAFDPALPLASRCDSLMAVLELVAHLSIERDEQTNPDAYADPAFREQEVQRRTLKGITDLRQIANMLELRHVMDMDNGHETWVDADGAQVSLLEVIENQMPDEELRNSSGRARQAWSFLKTAQAFREQGISDQRIAECARSGMSSVLGITAAAQRKLETVADPEELRDRYEELIDAAAETTTLDGLKKRLRTIVDPSDTPPPPIPYSAELNCERTYVVARLSETQFVDVFLSRLGDMLEVDKLLSQEFVDFWRQGIVPPGHPEKRTAHAGTG